MLTQRMVSLAKTMGIVLVVGLALGARISAQTIVVRPAETEDVLVNPGMGIETFQRFNGQPLNDGVRWSEVGPEKAAADATTVDFPPSTVAYLRWFWSQIEPERGTYRWAIVDDALAEAHRHGQRLAIRIMPYDDKHAMPNWYIKSGAKRANAATDKDGAIWSPDADDPLYTKYWNALVVEAGKRYDAHPDLNHVDVSTVGYWGEGWGPHLPSWQVQQQLIDVYFTSFTRTPLLMNFDALPALQYGVKRGAGWRLDCWGDMGAPGRTFAHMKDFYPQQLARGGLQEAWRTHPIALETCWVPEQWYQWKFPLKPILDQALRWHASTINIKSSRIPAEWRPAFDEFQKQIGYRFVLKRFEYPSHVSPGAMAPIAMWWFNAGVAPVYQSYSLALAIGDTVVPLEADVTQWLPGDAVVEHSIAVPRALTPGRYPLRVALLDPVTRKPAIRLAIEGRQDDGWYTVGEIQVE